MLGTIYIGLSGMNAYSKGLEVISNNVANLNTPGFKLTVPAFSDALARNGGGAVQGSADSRTGGAGVSVDTQQPSFNQGDLRDTGNSLDAGVEGNGFFVIERDGQHLFTRAGQFEFDDDGVLVDRETGGKVLVSTDGSAATTFNISELRNSPPRATSEVTLSGTLARTTTATFDLPGLSVIDSSGTIQILKARFTRNDSDPLTWVVEVSDAAGVVIGQGTIKFAADGTPQADATSVDITVKPANLPEFTFTLKMGAAGSYSGVTSPATSTNSQLTVLKQNGLAVGTLSQTSFDDRGRLTLTYSNGEKATPVSLLLARFDSAKQVRALGDSLYVAADGQEITLATAQTSGRGRVVGGKIELSNVDLTQQFTDLIIIQRGYQASSQMTSVANEMIQQLLAIGDHK